ELNICINYTYNSLDSEGDFKCMKAGRPREGNGGGGSYNFYVSHDLIDAFEKTLPRDKSVAKGLREIMEKAILEKKQEALLDLSPVRQQNTCSNLPKYDEINNTLDQWINQGLDIETIMQIEGKVSHMLGYVREQKKTAKIITWRK